MRIDKCLCDICKKELGDWDRGFLKLEVKRLGGNPELLLLDLCEEHGLEIIGIIKKYQGDLKK